MSDIDKERADFSIWAKSENFNTNWHSVGKFFTSQDTQIRWEVWRAALAATQQAPAYPYCACDVVKPEPTQTVHSREFHNLAIDYRGASVRQAPNAYIELLAHIDALLAAARQEGYAAGRAQRMARGT